MTDQPRPYGYYWVRNRESGEKLVGYFVKGDWTFTGALWVFHDDEAFEDGQEDTFLDAFEVLRRLPEPTDRVPMTAVLIGKRFGVPTRIGCEDQQSAIGMAHWAIEDNTFGPERVEDMKGNVLLDRNALMAARDAYGDARDD